FFKLAKFEINYFRKQPSFYVTALIFFLLAFFAMISENVQIGVRGANINFNSPQAITEVMIIMSWIGMFLVANFVGGTATRDYVFKMNGISHTLPIDKKSYLWGRLLGALIFCLLVYLVVPIGTLIGSFWPGVDAERLGTTLLAPYFWSFLVFVVPNFLFCAVLFYSFAMFSRSMMGMYLGVLGFFILNSISGRLISDPSLKTLSAMLDPFGHRALSETTRYWTPFEMNTQVFSLDGLILENRLLWLGITVMVMLLTHYFINIRKVLKVKKAKSHKTEAIHKDIFQIAPQNSSVSQWLRFKFRTIFEIKQVIKTPAFIILSLLVLFLLLLIFVENNGIFGTSNWPLSRFMADYILGSFSLVIFIIITYYAAETVWRERQLGIGDIVESTVTANWALYFPKIIALSLIMVIMMTIGVGFTVFYQTIKGYMLFEWDVYFAILFLQFLVPIVMTCVLSVFIQILSPNKFMGMLIFVLYIISTAMLANLGFEHNLWHFSEFPSATFSDMNAFGHFLKPMFFYSVYWFGFSLILVVLGYGMYRRGREYGLRYRFSLLKTTLGTAGLGAIAFGGLLFIGFGSYIYYNTQILNSFQTQEQQLDLAEQYEIQYKQFEDFPIPKITDVYVNVDIYPEQRKVTADGYYIIKNKTAQPIEKTLLIWDMKSQTEVFVENAEFRDFDNKHNTGWLHFEPAFGVGESRKMTFKVLRESKGFVDKNADNSIVANGSFINNFVLMPHFGYNSRVEISDRHERRKRDLPPPERLPKLEDESQYRTSFIGKEADFISFETIVSTRKDQIAISPGYLQKQWNKNGRSYFHYKMDAPIFNFAAFLSGRYEVLKENYKGISIEIYHHPEHNKNTQRMIDATKLSLDYFNVAFSAYQHRQVRIIEFPRYARFAQSFSNTIPYSEDIGFIADLRDPEDIDYVTFVTAHEMAHQWWGHQVMPANVQGSAVLSESLSEYSAYMVMEKLYGEHQLRKFLKWEMDRYLRGRGNELLEEMPLMRAENQQYIHYQKGGVVMYALRDRLGEETFNTALRNFLEEFQYQSAPYPTTLDLMGHIKAVATDNDLDFIDDMFTKITLFDLKTKSAKAKKLDNGNYKVELVFEAEKYYADGKGEEDKTTLDDYFDVGIFSQDPDDSTSKDHVLIFKKERIKSGENKLSYIVSELPKFAGLDPYIKMIDRNSDDNLIAVELEN
ncbi:MAG: hypothetical protein L3J52_00850, partial [Proteobacteria bacterium]|nr:hypothetical protein [Pseudomonadota bacterium]